MTYHKWTVPDGLLVRIETPRIIAKKKVGNNVSLQLPEDIIGWLKNNNVEYWLHIGTPSYFVFKSKSIPTFLKLRFGVDV
jgi:hypothetical protein